MKIIELYHSIDLIRKLSSAKTEITTKIGQVSTKISGLIGKTDTAITNLNAANSSTAALETKIEDLAYIKSSQLKSLNKNMASGETIKITGPGALLCATNGFYGCTVTIDGKTVPYDSNRTQDGFGCDVVRLPTKEVYFGVSCMYFWGNPERWAPKPLYFNNNITIKARTEYKSRLVYIKL